MRRAIVLLVGATMFAMFSASFTSTRAQEIADKPPQRPLRVEPAPIGSDKSVKYDFDIVYVRAPRTMKEAKGEVRPAAVWPDAGAPGDMRAATDLMLLHPDGSQEVLVAGGDGAIADPYVSFDAQWVYYTRFHDHSGHGGADVYKVNVKSRQVVRLTQQEWTPNTGAIDAATLEKSSQRGVYNMHPCPLPGGRVAFVSNCDGLQSPRRGHFGALQLFVMDDDGKNVEKIGHMNIGEALHPVILKDGRIIFSSLEIQGKRNAGWGIMGIHPDGTNWDPVISALGYGGAAIPFHFQTQLSDGGIVTEHYYIPAMGGFGVLVKQPPRPPRGTPPFLPAKWQDDPKMSMMTRPLRLPFKPYGMEVLTPFTHNHDSPALRCDPDDRQSPHVGWVTHPCGAPDNHLLLVWSGVMPHDRGRITGDDRPLDAGIYLIKEGRPLWDPGDMLLVKDDPDYNEQWPRPLVSYRRIYGVDEPAHLPSPKNDGKLSKHLPEGTPFGLVGSSSLYKRETYPHGEVPEGSVTATGAPYSAFPTREHRTNWDGQGADAGLYENSDIHAVRILAMEPPSTPVVGKFSNLAGERLRILGEFPVRKFPSSQPSAVSDQPEAQQADRRKLNADSSQPIDPDGNPDTSFLVKIPADVAWTFQTLDKDGMVLNMAQTWHQVRPGEIRNNCGGCHAHSQQPTLFKDTYAARPDYEIFDLTKSHPLLADKERDKSGKQWDVQDETGVRFAENVLNVEYHRDIRPIFERSCVACHSETLEKPAGGLVLDYDRRLPDHIGTVTYHNLVHPRDSKARRYIWPSQSRNSLLTWKIFGRRTDGFPEEMVAGAEGDHAGHLARGGAPYEPFKGSIMPPPDAVAGTYKGPDGRNIKVAPLSDEDRRMLVRWIDLGCPIDHDYDPENPARRCRGWMLDDQRPTLAVTYPKPGANDKLERVLIGMHDYYTGIDPSSLHVTASIAIDGAEAGTNVADRFVAKADGVYEWKFDRPLESSHEATLVIAVKDREGNETRMERTFTVERP